jgi:type II restriction/modification system DNA methylase subunit YeeA
VNTNNLKKYAPQARRQFISAVLKRINELGIYSDTQIGEASLQGDIYSIEGRNFDQSVKPQRERLIAKVKTEGFLHLVEQVASTWFNRFCAIRFMELKDGYLGHYYRVLSHPNNPTGYEILDNAQEAAQDLDLNKEEVIELKLAGNKEEELFRKLLLAQCHQLHIAMPFLFEALDDETELLLPQNLMRTDSIIRGLVDDIPESDWLQVEVIGWLYQFYISEKKDQVMGNVVKSEDIPAATQLFTPDWIVQYLVQNSVARQWLEVNPESNLIAKLKELSKDKLVARAEADKKPQQEIDAIEGEEFYIVPAEQSDEVNAQLKAQIPESIDPESIKVIDPACGSGHILIEAYNVLSFIYQEEGYSPRKIPQLILENNLFGLDIDDRAAQLTGIALMMMARKDDPRIFTRGIKLNVLAVKESTHLNIGELWKDLDLDNNQSAGTSSDLFALADDTEVIDTPEYKLLKQCKACFLQADTLGSLIDVPNEYESQLKGLHGKLLELLETGSRVQIKATRSILPFVHQALILSQRYDSLIANPPYMGNKGMNSEFKKFGKEYYPNSKSDLFSMFMERSYNLLNENGLNSQVNMQAWMFLSSYEKLRESIIHSKCITSLMQIGYNSFPELNSKVVQCVAFVIKNKIIDGFIGTYIDLNKAPQSANKKDVFFDENLSFRHQISQNKMANIPGSTFAYWASDKIFEIFSNERKLNDISELRSGISTGDNDQFYREWFEVGLELINFTSHLDDGGKWFPIVRGGEFRRWYGNKESVINLENGGYDILNSGNNFRLRTPAYYTKIGITWSRITSGTLSFRVKTPEVNFGENSPTLFSEYNNYKLLAILNSKIADYFLKLVSPTLSNQVLDVGKIPIIDCNESIIQNTKTLIDIYKTDWNLFETSWNFQMSPLIMVDYKTEKLSNVFSIWKDTCSSYTAEAKRLEEENNKYLITLYDVRDEMNSEIQLEEITLFSNWHFRNNKISNVEERINRFRSDTFSELLSYSIGCMMGRYSLEREGLIYASSSNDGFETLVAERAYGSFSADDDGIVPLTDEEWFEDDATIRFRDFVSKVWGDKSLTENLEFVAESLCLHVLKAKPGESSMATIRRYFSTQFYKDHFNTYKKRPIYWLFSSGKEKAFECLVYLHRYNEGTLARMRTQYVTPLLGKQDARIGQLEQKLDSASTSEANKLKRSIISIEKKQAELRKFDDNLKHYADMRIALNLDDGVKVNYGKFGDLLAEVKAIHGKIVK